MASPNRMHKIFDDTFWETLAHFRFRLLLVRACCLITVAIAVGCHHESSGERDQTTVLRLAVTTSTRDSGLLDVLLPNFSEGRNVRIDVIAAGTGKALKLGESGDVDVVLVHARAAEDAFMEAGHGIRREDVMFNTFQLLGPPSDPAKIRGVDAIEALRRIGATKQRFVSRGDDSGTHKRELHLWEQAGGRPDWKDYVETGQGMGASLVVADQMEAYVLADRGTYLKFQGKIKLTPLTARSDAMKNPYGILVVNPRKHPRLQLRLANSFVDFVISADGQQLIKDYTIDGEQLFHPSRLDD